MNKPGDTQMIVHSNELPMQELENSINKYRLNCATSILAATIVTDIKSDLYV